MLKKLPITTQKSSHRNRSEGSDFFIQKNGYITLSDGTTFNGRMPGWQNGRYTGEVVFNTGMTGYVESLTDPSYAGQILVFTYPLIGNYGVNISSGESDKIQVQGVIVSEAAAHWNHTGSDRSLVDWLKQQHIPLLYGIDTRALTKYLRTKGTTAGVISSRRDAQAAAIQLRTKFVTVSESLEYNVRGRKRIVLVDCGAKENIVRSLVRLGLHVRRVPFDYDYTAESYDGVLISNGPGDPTDYIATIRITKKALANDKPVFGICLGSQIMGLASGAKTYKLKFGHRGHNQPCLDEMTKHASITSQNHGYAIDEKTLPKGWRVTFRNLNDGSVEGVEHQTMPFFSVQFHPEACPGPTDTAWLFDKFKEML